MKRAQKGQKYISTNDWNEMVAHVGPTITDGYSTQINGNISPDPTVIDHPFKASKSLEAIKIKIGNISYNNYNVPFKDNDDTWFKDPIAYGLDDTQYKVIVPSADKFSVDDTWGVNTVTNTVAADGKRELFLVVKVFKDVSYSPWTTDYSLGELNGEMPDSTWIYLTNCYELAGIGGDNSNTTSLVDMAGTTKCIAKVFIYEDGTVAKIEQVHHDDISFSPGSGSGEILPFTFRVYDNEGTPELQVYLLSNSVYYNGGVISAGPNTLGTNDGNWYTLGTECNTLPSDTETNNIFIYVNKDTEASSVFWSNAEFMQWQLYNTGNTTPTVDNLNRVQKLCSVSNNGGVYTINHERKGAVWFELSIGDATNIWKAQQIGASPWDNKRSIELYGDDDGYLQLYKFDTLPAPTVDVSTLKFVVREYTGYSQIAYFDMDDLVTYMDQSLSAETPAHNSLPGLQGGAEPDQYYHLTTEQYANLSAGSLDHDLLSNLDWLNCGHFASDSGNYGTLAGFSSSDGSTVFYSISSLLGNLQHSELGGLVAPADDHTQYLRLNGNDARNAMSGSIGDSSGKLSISSNFRSLYDTDENQTLDWANKAMYNNGVPAMNWGTGLLYTQVTESVSIDFFNRQLVNAAGDIVLDWNDTLSLSGGLSVAGGVTTDSLATNSLATDSIDLAGDLSIASNGAGTITFQGVGSEQNISFSNVGSVAVSGDSPSIVLTDTSSTNSTNITYNGNTVNLDTNLTVNGNISSSGDVTFTGEVTFTDISVNSLSSNYIQIYTDATPVSSAPGLIQWNTTYGTYDMGLLNNSVLQVGQEMMFYGKASENISNGDVCQFNGVQGDHILIKKVVWAELEDNPHYLLGVATDDITSGNFGYITWFGNVNDIYTDTPNNGDTVNWSAGDILYVNPSTGQLTNVKPGVPDRIITVAAVIKTQTGASPTGRLVVRPSWNSRIIDLDDVNGTPLDHTGQLLVWNQELGYFDFDYDIMDVGGHLGFENTTDSTISYESSSRLITVQPTASSFNYYFQGVRYSVGTDELSATHADTTGGYFLYYDDTNTLQFNTTPWDISNGVPIAYVYYSATMGEGIVFEERHNYRRNPLAHQEFHRTIGTYYVNGLAAADYTVQPVTPTDDDNVFSIATGVIADEDLQHTITALASGGPYYIFYRSGANGEWIWTTNTLPYAAGTYIQYNQDTGATWQLTELTTNQYVNMYVVAFGNVDTSKQIAVIVGQNVYTTDTEAQGVSFNEDVEFGTIPFQEICLIHRFTYRTSAAYSTTGKCRINAYSDLRGTTSAVTVLGGATSNHNSLGGLQGGSAGERYHLTAAEYTALHPALTVLDSPEIDLTVNNQVLSATLVAGSIDETKLDASVNASLDLADSALQSISGLSHTLLADIGSNTHTQIDTHISNSTIHYAQSAISIPASQISDFDTEVSNNIDVAANTSARHSAVTVTDSAEIDFTLTGQDITASLKTGSIDVLKLDSGVQSSLALADSAVQPAALASYVPYTGATTNVNLSGNSLLLNDNSKVIFGTGSDASIYYDNTNLIINPKEVGSGLVSITGTSGAAALQTSTGTRATIGNTTVGAWSNNVTYATFHHSSVTAATEYAFLQNASGGTYFNCAAGQSIFLRVGNSPIGNITSSGLKISTTAGAAGELLEVGGNAWLSVDNYKSLYGTGKDASIYYNGTNLIINPKEVGTGVVSLAGSLTHDESTAADFSIVQADQDKDILVKINDGGSTNTAIQVHGDNGIVSTPYQSSVSVGYTSNQAIPGTSTWTTLILSSESYDVQGEFNTGTYTFTATEAGKYLCICQALWATLASGTTIFIRLYKNGTTNIGENSLFSGGISSQDIYLNKIVDLAAGDTVVFQAWQNSGSDINVASRYLTIHKVS